MTDQMIGLIPPHSLEAEESVLGSMILDRTAINEATETLRANDFYKKWFNENKNYLYRTRESFHQFNSPQIYVVSLEAKYLCTPVSHEDGKFRRQLTEHEKQCLYAFSNIDDNTKALLANYSNFLFRQNYYDWNVWIHYPIYEQIRIARAAGGI